MRENFKHKICYKKKYNFVNLKHTPTNAIIGRLMKRGNFLKTYKLIKYFFIFFLLHKNFKSIPTTSLFLYFYNKFYSFRDLDRVLFWKYLHLDCMFRYKSKKLKKKKIFKHNLYFVEGKKRFILCINYLKYLILLYCKRKKTNISYNLFLPLSNYIIYEKNSMVNKIKYKIYKKKLVQMQS